MKRLQLLILFYFLFLINKAYGYWISDNNIPDLIKNSSAKVFIAGEEHTGEYLKRHLELLPKIKQSKPNLKYLFVEFPETRSKPFIEYLSENTTYAPDFDSITVLIKDYKPLFELAKKLDLDIVPVDADWTWDKAAREWKCQCDIEEKINSMIASGERTEIIDAFISENEPRVIASQGMLDRNQTMARNIMKVILNSDYSGILIVGKDHVYSHEPVSTDSSPDQIPSILNKLEVDNLFF